MSRLTFVHVGNFTSLLAALAGQKRDPEQPTGNGHMNFGR